ncbi:MAG: pyridoxal phosphate-dependent aminotransferase [Bacteroidales bacterium]|nr:pyridoxal phosphate-dependent aminotransferase [Bacteroidales bacterium]
MKEIISEEKLRSKLQEMGIDDISRTTIRQCSMVGSALEAESGEPFSHLEFGVPGIPACPIGIEAQKKALDAGVPSSYPSVQGIPELKRNAARFVKAFIDIDIDPKGIVPTVGSMQGSMTCILECSQLQPGKDTILYICPGFSAHGRQPDLLGIKNIFFDIYEYRAEKLRDKLESYFSQGNIAAILYSNPNNPAWICLTEEELQTIGELATKYDVIVLEDMAYLCMDFRKDMSVPFEPPFQSTVARYTDNYIIFLSASKIFSYAGERIAVVCISDKLYHREYPQLKERWRIAKFGDNFILNYLYVNTSGVSHSAQYALSAMFEASADGRYNFVKELRNYGLRAHKSRHIFDRNGFHLVYDKDMEQTISDGFFYTVTYKDLNNRELLEALLRCGVIAIPLNTTGSGQCGIRVCVSRLLTDEDFRLLNSHLKMFVRLVEGKA